jgi:hypothetical protein
MPFPLSGGRQPARCRRRPGATTTTGDAVVKPAAPAPAKAPAVDAPATVSVTAERPTGRIDRQVYDVKSDVGSTNGTAADA